MSRIGKKPISIPKGVEINVSEGNYVKIKGPKGSLEQQLPEDISIEQDNGVLTVARPSDEQRLRALHGLTRSLLANMVTGVTEGYQRTLEISGVGFRASREGSNIFCRSGSRIRSAWYRPKVSHLRFSSAKVRMSHSR